MKIQCLKLDWLLALMIVFSPNALLADTKTATVNVSATLQPSCQAGTGSAGATSFGTLDFGTQIFLTSNVSVIGSTIGGGAINVQCNAGTSYQILIGGGNSNNVNSRYMVKSATGEKIYYNLYIDSGHATVWDNTTGVAKTASGGTDLTSVYGLTSSQATPSTGIYSDSVIVTVSW